MWGKKMALQAQIRGRRIEVRTENVQRFHLKMEGPLEKALRSLKVDVDGFSVRVRKAIPGDWIGMEAKLGEDGKVKGWSAEKRKEAPEDQAVLGTVPITLTREGLDSPLGNWFTDAIRWATGADVAFQNNGGIRKDLEKGPVTVADIFELNFPDELYTFEVTGKELLAILEHDVRDEKERPMQVSGLRYTFDRSRPEAPRIVRSTVEPDKVYTVGAEDFLSHRGEQFFGGKVAFINTGIHIVDAQIRYFRQMKKIGTKSEGRIEEIGTAR
jgi:hypothetical protein